MLRSIVYLIFKYQNWLITKRHKESSIENILWFVSAKKTIQTKEVYFFSNLLLTIVFKHPFIANVTDNKPLKELYNEAKAVVIEELEDLPEDKEVLL